MNKIEKPLLNKEDSSGLKEKKPSNPPFKEVKAKVREALNPYIFGDKDDPLIEIATKIWALFDFVFDQLKDKSPNKQREIEEFNSAKNTCRKEYADKYLGFILSDLVQKQAKTYWHLNGCTVDNNQERIDNDWFNAKRFLGYMIAENLIQSCKDHQCAKVLLKHEFKEYLNILSVEEFIRFRAYLIWNDRNNGKDWSQKDADKSNDDYFKAAKVINGVFKNCNNELCSDKNNKDFWEKSIGKLQEDLDAESIITAKINRINRLLKNSSEYTNKIKKYVELYYSNVEQFTTTGKTTEPDILGKIIEKINSEYYVSNMLEYISKCALLCKLTKDTHDTYCQNINQ